MESHIHLEPRIRNAAIVFRGFGVTNLGRSRELLAHPAYGPIVKRSLREVSDIFLQATGTTIDLVTCVREGRMSRLESFPQDVATIVGMEMAQLRILEEVFRVPVTDARLTFGYSIGELSALVMAGMFRLEDLLPVPLRLATDCAQLAGDTTMGVLFTRGPELPLKEVRHLCRRISSRGDGLIGPSSYLAPNTALILGQGNTLSHFEKQMGDALPERSMLRRNPHRWPPLHTPLVWHRSVPNRVAVDLYRIEGALPAPKLPVLAMATGKPDYSPDTARDLLVHWTDHPQLLWDAIYHTLSIGVDLVIHVGPEPELVPSTYDRIAANVNRQYGRSLYQLLGRSVLPTLGRHTWLTSMLPSKAALLRAPHVQHVILEDWLLGEHPKPAAIAVPTTLVEAPETVG